MQIEFPRIREIYTRDPKEIRDDGLQGHDHTYGIEPEAIEWCLWLEAIDATMYRQMIGSLMYLTNIRPNIWFAVNTLSQFLTDLRHVHLIVAVDYGLMYEASQKINLEGYVDSDWAGSAIDRKSTSGCFFSMGLCVISWLSRK